MFYTTLIMDNKEVLHFKIEAEHAAAAVRVAGAYLKGRFEGSGMGGEIASVTKLKTRGVDYRGL